MWLDKVINSIKLRNSDGKVVLTTSVSPSGIIHVGKLRDISIVYFLNKQLRQDGRKTKTILYWDDFDTFSKNKFDRNLDRDLGKPLCSVLKENRLLCEEYKNLFLNELKELGIEFDLVVSQASRYMNGTYNKYLMDIDKNKDKVIGILKNYIPNLSLHNYKLYKFYCVTCNRSFSVRDLKEETLCVHCGCENNVSKNVNRIKMPFVMEWAVRWKHDKSDFEPIGKDHATSNGAFVRSKDISEKLLNFCAPVVQRFEFVGISKEKKMSVSEENGITIKDLSLIFPKEIVLWIFFKSNPHKYLVLDFSLEEKYLNCFIQFIKLSKIENMDFERFSNLINMDTSFYKSIDILKVKEIFHLTKFIDTQANLNKIHNIYVQNLAYQSLLNYFLNFKKNHIDILNINKKLLEMQEFSVILPDLIRLLRLSDCCSYSEFSEYLKKSELSKISNLKLLKTFLFRREDIPPISKMLYIYSSNILKEIEEVVC